jgi:glycosyltransferase involved in cell wall biosynthesis
VLRIAHVTATFPPYKGGTGNVAWHLTRELAARGHDVHVLTADLGGDRVAPEGVRVHRLPPFVRIGNAPALPGLLRALRGFDLVHLHFPFYFGAETVWLASRLYRTPYVVTYHNDVRLTGLLRPAPRLYRWVIGDRILADASVVLFTTLDYARSSDARWLLGRGNAVELPLGVDAGRFSPRPAGQQQLRQRYGFDAEQVLVLFVASLDRPHYFKGLTVLLESMCQLRDLPLSLLVVGDGDLRPAYTARVDQLGLADRVRFAGAVSDAALPAFYAAADMLVLPSVTRGEAFGLVLLEALASGKPVIASDLPGVRQVVRRTGGGLLVPAGNAGVLAGALRRLAADPSQRAAFGAAGLRAVRAEYEWSTLTGRLEACYTEATQRSKNAHRVRGLRGQSAR